MRMLPYQHLYRCILLVTVTVTVTVTILVPVTTPSVLVHNAFYQEYTVVVHTYLCSSVCGSRRGTLLFLTYCSLLTRLLLARMLNVVLNY